MHATSWMNLKNTESDRIQMQKTITYWVIPCICQKLLHSQKIIMESHPVEVEVIFTAYARLLFLFLGAVLTLYVGFSLFFPRALV